MYSGNRDEINKKTREWYHRTGYSKVKTAKTKQRRVARRKWFDSYKSNIGCKCGESHPGCLDYHHKNGDDKKLELSRMIEMGFSIKNILKEVEKCTLMCANCHRKLHYSERHNNI